MSDISESATLHNTSIVALDDGLNEGPANQKPGRRFNLRRYIKEAGLNLTDYPHIIIASVGMSLLSLSVPIMTLQVYDRILGNPDGGTLPILLTGVVFALIFEAGLRLGRNYVIQYANAIFEHKMNCKVFFHSIHSDFSKIVNFDPGTHLQRFGSINDLKEDFTGSNFVTVCETCLLPVFFILLMYIAGWLTIVPMMICCLYTLFALCLGHRLKYAIQVRDEYDERRYSFLVSTLAGIHTIKAFAAEKLFERRYEKYKEEMGTSQHDVAILNSAISNLGNIFGSLMTLSVITAGAFLVIQKDLTTGGLIATIMIVGRIMQPVQKIVGSIIRKREAKMAYDDLSDLLTTPTHRPIDDLYEDMALDKPNVAEPSGEIAVNNLCFKFADAPEYIFYGLNFHAKPKEMVNISGRFGQGKSTLMKLFCGLYPPTEGEVLVDGYPVSQYSQAELPKHIGYIESRGVVFHGSIRDNITRFGLTPENQAREAATLLNMNKEIAMLPSGFDTMLTGKKSDNVQPDLRQKIAIARTLAAKPKILLFDEPNRDLDYASYNNLFQVLAKLKGHVTIILISGDKNLTSLCDRFYTIHDKMLQES